MQEEWRSIRGYEGYYEVSSFGRVRSLDRTVPHPRFGTWRRRGALLKQVANTNGYVAVQLCREGTVRRHRTNILVAEAFLGNRPAWATQVNHKNKVITDNTVDNLEWSNSLHNVRHAAARYAHGDETLCLTELAERAGLPRSTVSKRIHELGWSVEKAISTPVRGTK
jgi:hypothetical protein